MAGTRGFIVYQRLPMASEPDIEDDRVMDKESASATPKKNLLVFPGGEAKQAGLPKLPFSNTMGLLRHMRQTFSEGTHLEAQTISFRSTVLYTCAPYIIFLMVAGSILLDDGRQSNLASGPCRPKGRYPRW